MKQYEKLYPQFLAFRGANFGISNLNENYAFIYTNLFLTAKLKSGFSCFNTKTLSLHGFLNESNKLQQ